MNKLTVNDTKDWTDKHWQCYHRGREFGQSDGMAAGALMCVIVALVVWGYLAFTG